MREVGIRKFRLKLYQMVKGNFPIVITRYRSPVYILTKIDKDKPEKMKCEFCHKVKECNLRGICIDGNLNVKDLCKSCEAKLIRKGVEIL